MNSLKAAFGKQDKSIDKFSSNMSQSIKKFNKNNSQSMWALGMDNNNQISLDSDQKLEILNRLLRNAFDKDNNLTATNFDRIVEDFQDQIETSSSNRKSEISYYLVLQDKLTDLMEICSKSDSDFHGFVEVFHEKVESRILTLRNKQKKVESKDYDQIVHKNFKKKADFLDVGAMKNQSNIKKNHSKSRDEKQNSNQKKLNRLLSKQKNFREKQIKKEQQQHDDYLMSQSMLQKNESISFSSVMSTSVAVKQRRPRKNSGQFNYGEQGKQFGNKKLDKKTVASTQNEEDEEHEKTDKAFIFYRPKKGKKV